MPNTIALKGQGIRKERVAAAGSTIFPGDLVDINSSGEVLEHATAGGNALPAFAVENEVVGQEISEVYLAGDNVLYEVFHTGCEVYAWLAAGQDVAVGALLESATAGALRAHTPIAIDEGGAVNHGTVYFRGVVARALEAVDNDPGSGGAPVRIIVEIL